MTWLLRTTEGTLVATLDDHTAGMMLAKMPGTWVTKHFVGKPSTQVFVMSADWQMDFTRHFGMKLMLWAGWYLVRA